MADTHTQTTTPPDARLDESRTDRASASAGLRPASRRETQETRRAFTTTEFYAMIVAVAGLLIAGQIDSSGLDERTSWQLATLVAIAYVVSRGLAKIGSQREYYDLR
ncbi:MAG: hypothetical protein ACXWCM_01575 [Acidimicrobiales bacterium]